ncbi:MAG TPA: AMP-dependent synthetase/ligase [Pilimelia sp.]|nr:AMP-dependent synthetase/ligase [Pilimelia sp.]
MSATTRVHLDVAAVRTVAELPFAAADSYGDNPAVRFRRGDGWHDRSYTELAGTVRALALGLIESGLAPGDRVCVLADTRPEWSEAGLAVLAAGGVLVPIYPSSSPEECAWVAGNSGARMIVCENPAQLAKIDSVRDRLPELAATVLIDPAESIDLPDDDPHDGAGRHRHTEPPHRTLADLFTAGNASTRGDELARRQAAIKPGDPSLIIYTSGTTGPAKGCVLTHTNWLALCKIIQELDYVAPDEVVYLFLPLAHVFAQIVQFGALYSGATLVYYGGDPRRVIPELAEVRPTFLPSIPRIFEKLYTLFTAGADPAWLERAVQAGLEVRRRERAGEKVPEDVLTRFLVAEPLFAKVRGAFGGRLRMALTGAAPIATPVLEFFHAAGVPVLEGYGMTESTAVGTVSTLDRFRLGSVGVAAPDVRLRCAEDGEVLMAGPHVFDGYWGNEAATRETIVDGWLHTGDLGALDADGFLTITGRKKDIIITSGGKNIAPANLENELRQSRWISHAVMYGDRRPYPVALITLDPEEIIPWARERGLPTDVAALALDPAVRELIQGVVDTVNAGHFRASQVKRFVLLDRDLSQDAGELTPTLKVKRSVVHANHAGLYDALYREEVA